MTALILHGGAGARRERNYDAEVVHMREVVEAMKARLDAGDSALDVAVEAVAGHGSEMVGSMAMAIPIAGLPSSAALRV